MTIVRAPKDFFFGTLGQAAALTDTSLQSPVFANLPNTYSTSRVLPLVLLDLARGVYEVVWVTGHVASSQTVTVVRGKEGSTAQAWPQFSQVQAAPTAARDTLAVQTSTTRPADAHLGMEAIETDTNQITQLTSSGWLNGVYADPAGLNPGHGSATPATAVPILKAFTQNHAIVGSSGIATFTFPGTPFPNGVIAVMCIVNSTVASSQSVKVVNGTTTTSGVQVLGRTSTGGIPPAGDDMPLDFIVIGY
jgi:hypothetical protein